MTRSLSSSSPTRAQWARCIVVCALGLAVVASALLLPSHRPMVSLLLGVTMFLNGLLVLEGDRWGPLAFGGVTLALIGLAYTLFG